MNILIPLLSGSEFRQFFLSDIVKNLIDDNHQIYTMVKNNDEKLTKLIKEYEPRVTILSHEGKHTKSTSLSYVRFLLDYEYDLYNKRWKYAPNNSIAPTKKLILNVLSFFLKNRFIKEKLLRYERKLFFSQNFNNTKVSLQDNNIDLLLVNIARILLEPKLLISAYQLNIHVKVIYHSNKEINAQNRISYPYHSIAVWNSKMKDDLQLQLPSIDNINIEIIGNTHFTSLNISDNLMSKTNFEKTFDIKSSKIKVLLYTAAGVIVKNEFLIVDFIATTLKAENRDFKIIVRQNPMDTSNTWEEYFKNIENVCIQKPKWHMNNDVGLNYTLPEDLIEYTSLLSYCDICINIPSTVTLECAIKKLPVINICFDLEGIDIITNDGQMISFWNAPFYKEYQKYDFIYPAYSLEDLKQKINQLCFESKEQKFNDYGQCLSDILSFDLDTIRQKTKTFILENKEEQ